jgi:hypothetical protein
MMGERRVMQEALSRRVDVDPPDPKQRRNHKGTTGVGAPTPLVKRISLGGLRVNVSRPSRNGF